MSRFVNHVETQLSLLLPSLSLPDSDRSKWIDYSRRLALTKAKDIDPENPVSPSALSINVDVLQIDVFGFKQNDATIDALNSVLINFVESQAVLFVEQNDLHLKTVSTSEKEPHEEPSTTEIKKVQKKTVVLKALKSLTGSFNPSTTIINDTNHPIHVGIGHVGPIMYTNELEPGQATTFKNAPWGGYRIVARGGWSPAYGTEDVAKPIMITTGLTFAGTVAVVSAAFATLTAVGAGTSASVGTSAATVTAASASTASGTIAASSAATAVGTSTATTASSVTAGTIVTSTATGTAASTTAASGTALAVSSSASTATATASATAAASTSGGAATGATTGATTIATSLLRQKAVSTAKDLITHPMKAYGKLTSARIFYRDTLVPMMTQKEVAEAGSGTANSLFKAGAVGGVASLAVTSAGKAANDVKKNVSKGFEKVLEIFVDPIGIVHSDHWCNWGKHLTISIGGGPPASVDPETADLDENPYTIQDVSVSKK